MNKKFLSVTNFLNFEFFKCYVCSQNLPPGPKESF